MRDSLMRSFVLLFLTATAHGYQFNKRVNIDRLQRDLKSGGFNVSAIYCNGTDCRIEWGLGGESKSPKSVVDAHIYEEPFLRRVAELKSLKALTEKWSAGTITAAEKDDLLRRFVTLYLSGQ